MITANDLRKGVVIRTDGELMVVQDFQHVKPGKGGAFVKAKLKNIKKNIIIEKTFRSTEKVEDVFIEKRSMQCLYRDKDSCVFMDLDTYEQIGVPVEKIAEESKFLKEGQQVDASFYEGEVISLDLPTFVELEISHTEPGIKGDTATATFKPATLETDARIQVPLFINRGDKVKIDTRTGEYIERL
ncbi:MAG: elongation factor P [Spirochaetota bacterium]